MTHDEQQLINEIKQLPGHQVFDGRNGGSVVVAITKPNGVKQVSVWLGRNGTIDRLQSVLKDSFLDKAVVHIGDTWKVVGVGAMRDGNTFCLMANTHRGRQQKNGWCPFQINDWVDTAVLKAAK